MTAEEIRSIVVNAIGEVLNSKEKKQQEEFDARYKNVRLLLRNYRKLKKFQAHFVADVSKVESVGMMKSKTDLLMIHLDKMLKVYKVLCQEEDAEEKKRKWQSLYLRYISEEKMTIEQITNLLSIDRRTFYRDIEKALKDIAVLLFGVEALGTW